MPYKLYTIVTKKYPYKVTEYSEEPTARRTCEMHWTRLDLPMCLNMCRIKNQTEIGRTKELEQHIKLVQQCDYYGYDEESDSYFVNNLQNSCVSV